jgi:hypothetical protein
MSILITAANSAPAHRLKSKLTTDDVILGDHLDLPDFMVKTGKMVRLPDPRSNTYTHEMLALCLDNAFTAIYPLNAQEASLLLESRQLFKEYGIDIVITDDEI